MRLINLGTSDLKTLFTGDEHFDATDVSYGARFNLYIDDGLNYWFMKGENDLAPPIEFRFNNDGLFESVSIYLRKDSVVHCSSPAEYKLPPLEATVPKVSMKIWHELKTSVVEEKTTLYTWLESQYLWVMRARTKPHSCFDTGAGIFVIFDEDRAFSGVAIDASRGRSHIERIIGEKT